MGAFSTPSTEYQDLNQKARLVAECSIYDPSIYNSTVKEWIDEKQLQQVIDEAKKKPFIKSVRGPLTKDFGQTIVTSKTDTKYPRAGPPCFEPYEGRLNRCNSSALDALITMFRFLDFSSNSKERRVADYIHQQVTNPQPEIAQQFLQLMGRYWEGREPDTMVDTKSSFWQLMSSKFAPNAMLEGLWDSLVQGEALPDFIDFTLVGDCWDCIL